MKVRIIIQKYPSVIHFPRQLNKNFHPLIWRISFSFSLKMNSTLLILFSGLNVSNLLKDFLVLPQFFPYYLTLNQVFLSLPTRQINYSKVFKILPAFYAIILVSGIVIELKTLPTKFFPIMSLILMNDLSLAYLAPTDRALDVEIKVSYTSVSEIGYQTEQRIYFEVNAILRFYIQ